MLVLSPDEGFTDFTWGQFLGPWQDCPLSTIQIHSGLYLSLHISSGPPQFSIGTHYLLFTISFLQMIKLRQDEVNCVEFAWIECIIAIFHIDQSVFRVLLTYLIWCLFTAFPSFFVRWIFIFYGLFTLRFLRQTIWTKIIVYVAMSGWDVVGVVSLLSP